MVRASNYQTLGCINVKGSSAASSPARGPRYSLTLTLYWTIIPRFSFCVGSWMRVLLARFVSSCFSWPSSAVEMYVYILHLSSTSLAGLNQQGHLIKVLRQNVVNSSIVHLIRSRRHFQDCSDTYPAPTCPCYCSAAALTRTPAIICLSQSSSVQPVKIDEFIVL